MAKVVSQKRAEKARAGLKEVRKGGVTKAEKKKAARLKKILRSPRKVPTAARPGTPGVRENTRQPFHTGDEQESYNEQIDAWNEEDSDAQTEYETRVAELPQTLEDIQKAATKSREQTGSNAIERGIFQSSINQMAVTDINAAETNAQNAANKLVANAGAELFTLRANIEGRLKPRLQTNYNQQGRNNAEDWNESQPWKEEPTAATPAGTTVDYDPKTPGIQTRGQARNAAARRQEQSGQNRGNGGRGSGQQRPQPNKPNVARINRRLASGNLNRQQTATLRQRRQNIRSR